MEVGQIDAAEFGEIFSEECAHVVSYVLGQVWNQLFCAVPLSTCFRLLLTLRLGFVKVSFF